MTQQPVPLGKVITGLRTQRGMSMAELARLADISKGYLHSIEVGVKSVEPSVYIVARIAKVFGVQVEDLISAHSEPAIECPVCSGRGWCNPEDLVGVHREQASGRG